MKINELIPEMEEMLGFEAGTVDLNAKIADVPEWDSMAILSFIAFIEDKFEIVLEGDQITQVTTFKELFGLLGDKIEF